MDIRNIDYIIIEPMIIDNDEFIGKSVQEVQMDYFAKDLIYKYEYRYFYETIGISKSRNNFDTLILFQMNSSIIASAILRTVMPFPEEYKLNFPEYSNNNGCYILKEKSVLIFNPIMKEELRGMIKGFKDFNRRQKYRKFEVDIEKLNKRINDNTYQQKVIR